MREAMVSFLEREETREEDWEGRLPRHPVTDRKTRS